MALPVFTLLLTTIIVVVASSSAPGPQEAVTVISSDCNKVLNVNGLTVISVSKPVHKLTQTRIIMLRDFS